jgi:hypothetical protein
LVVERLTVAANQIEFGVVSFSSALYRVCIQLTEQEVQARQIRYARRTSVHCSQNPLSHSVGIWDMLVREQAQAKAATSAEDADDCNVDAVRRRAAHHTGDDHAFCAAFFWTASLNS